MLLFPTITAEYPADDTLVNSKFHSKMPLGNLLYAIGCSDLYNCICGKFGPYMILSKRMASFAGFVLHVFGISPGEEMGRIAARRIIAGVECEEWIRIFPREQKQCNSMRSYSYPCMIAAENSIPGVVFTAYPRPTSVWTGRTIHFVPEVFALLLCESWDWVRISTRHLILLADRVTGLVRRSNAVPAYLTLTYRRAYSNLR